MEKSWFTEALQPARPHSSHGGLTPDAERRRHADAAGRLRYPDGSAVRPLQPAQDFGHNPNELSQ